MVKVLVHEVDDEVCAEIEVERRIEDAYVYRRLIGDTVD